MKKKILVIAPVLTMSGYGFQSRFALKALRTQEQFEIFVQPTNWGRTGWLWRDNEFRNWIDERIVETQTLIHKRELFPDISLQITIPNEWKRISPTNIGYTAGIETNLVSREWIEKGNEMDKIVVVSQHSKKVYEKGSAKTNDGQTIKLTTPVDVVNYPVRSFLM